MEILTSSNQTPKSDWLNIVVSTKARNKIKQSLNEEMQRRADLGKEILERRAKNRKIELEEAVLMKLINKTGYKYANEFFADMADEKIDAGKFLATYIEETTAKTEGPKISAGEYQMKRSDEEPTAKNDVLVIGDKTINGLKYKFAKCCSPIYGDDVFGFISSDGMVKIHRCDCPNATNIRERYPYRVIRADWSGKQGDMLPVSLKIIGNDDIGIMANITSIISKEMNVNLRNISVDSHDGMFQGILVVAVNDQRQLTLLLKKLKTIKGIKDIQRL